MDNNRIASVLQETADLIELTGGNPHRARAFGRAARALSSLDEPATDRLQAGTLMDIDGIGSAMAEHVEEIVHVGSFPLHDELLSVVPPGLMDVLEVQGLGTKRTRRLWTDLDVTSLDDLEHAAETDRIMSLDGFGRKTQEKILENVRQLRRYEAQWRLGEVWPAAQAILQRLRSVDAVERAERTGALRRRMETVDRIEMLVATSRPAAVADWLETEIDEFTQLEETAVEGVLEEGLPLRVHLAPPERFGTSWWETTGSPAHCEAFKATAGPPAAHSDETDLFDAADLPVIPPELRENRGELDAATRNELPNLITSADLDGCLHNHSTYSDGAASIREMADAARNRGYSYFGICDHSQSLNIANGLSPTEVREQQAEVDRINDTVFGDESFAVFRGIESDVLRDGSLDYEDEILSTFDFVVASVHTGFSMSKDEATTRLVRAIENPHTRILGHPTGRLLLRREGYPIDHGRVIEACAEHDVAIELNANPYRLDLDWRWIRTATDQDVLISINPDAHSIKEIDHVRWGVAVGRKGWLTADQCLNAKSLRDFRSWIGEGPSS